MKRILSIALFSLSFFCLCAQERQPWETYYEQLSDIDETESVSWETAYELLSDLAEYPIDLNQAGRDDIDQLFFLTKQQREELGEYLDRYAPIRSLGELAMIESLDIVRRRLLSYFVKIGPAASKRFPTLSHIAKYGRHTLLATAKIPFYERKGDTNGYLGHPYKHWLKYEFACGQYVKLGLVGAQDAGEPWFAGRNRYGYDYYSFYLQLKDMGRLKKLVVGRYRLKFGLGIAMNTDFGFGKLATLSWLGNASAAVRPHASRSEGNYLQGAAATVGLTRELSLTGFISYRKIDGMLNKDSASISTIVKTGYHRTLREMSRKHNTEELLTGAHLRLFKNGFHVALTGFATRLSRELRPKTTQLHRQYYLAGKAFWNTSADYGYTGSRLSVQGETATGNTHALATIHSASYQCTSTWSVVAVQRFYSYKYASLFSQSFSDGGTVQNESGLYIGTNWQPLRHLVLKAYADYAYSPWPKYQVSQSSSVWDYLLSAHYQHERWQLQGRYRLRIRQKDTDHKSALANETTHRGRLSAAFETHRWLFKTQADAACCRYPSNSFGYMITQHIGYRHRLLQAFANIAYFCTDDYRSRLYTYERGMLYTFALPVFSGQGMHYMINLRIEPNDSLMLMAKLNITDYFDRDHIGNSYQRIEGSAQTDLEMQLRWRF